MTVLHSHRYSANNLSQRIKPPGLLRINRNSAIGSRVLWSVLPGTQLTELCTGRVGNVIGAVKMGTATPYGLSANVVTAGANGIQWPNSGDLITRSIGTQFSIIAVVNLNASSNTLGSIMAFPSNDATFGDPYFDLDLGINAAVGATNSAYSMNWANGAVSGSQEYSNGVNGTVTTGFHVVIVTYDGATQTCYQDGLVLGTWAMASGGSPIPVPILAVNTGYSFISCIASNNIANQSVGGDIYMTSVINGALSPSEAALLTQSPYRFFEPSNPVFRGFVPLTFTAASAFGMTDAITAAGPLSFSTTATLPISASETTAGNAAFKGTGVLAVADDLPATAVTTILASTTFTPQANLAGALTSTIPATAGFGVTQGKTATLSVSIAVAANLGNAINLASTATTTQGVAASLGTSGTITSDQTGVLVSAAALSASYGLSGTMGFALPASAAFAVTTPLASDAARVITATSSFATTTTQAPTGLLGLPAASAFTSTLVLNRANNLVVAVVGAFQSTIAMPVAGQVRVIGGYPIGVAAIGSVGVVTPRIRPAILGVAAVGAVGHVSTIAQVLSLGATVLTGTNDLVRVTETRNLTAALVVSTTTSIVVDNGRSRGFAATVTTTTTETLTVIAGILTWVTPAGYLGGLLVSDNNAVIEGQPALGLMVSAVDPRGNPVSYSLLNGSLPPGIVLSSFGPIGGIMTNIPNNPPSTDFTFVVRATNGIFRIDRQFIIRGFPVPSNPVWNFASLPDITATPFPHYALPEFDRGEVFRYGLDVTDADNDTLIFTIQPVPDLPFGPFNGALPPGLSFDAASQTIDGVVSLTAPAGIYYFQMAVSDGSANDHTRLPAPVKMSIEISTDIVDDFESSIVLVWVTPAGLLGKLPETYPSYLAVKATTITTGIVTYSLIASAGSLPPGLTLNPTSGALSGIILFVSATTLFTFTIRAQSANIFADRTFSIEIDDLFNNTGNVAEFVCPLLGPIRQNWVAYYTTLLAPNTLFRATDPNFGLITSPSIYVIKGINAVSQDVLATVIDGTSVPGMTELWYRDMNLFVGEHRVAVARDGDGNVLYDVLYREVIDPQTKAGGFSLTSVPPVEQFVPYNHPGNPLDINIVYPNSFRNLRLNLVDQLGLAGSGLLAKLPGPTGIEAMPMWMKSQQVLNDPTTVLGYVPAIEIAYLLPGTGAAFLASMLSDGDGLFLAGRALPVDRFLVNTVAVSSTVFDNNTTNFDGGSLSIFDDGNDFSDNTQWVEISDSFYQINFDSLTIQDGKYYIFSK